VSLGSVVCFCVVLLCEDICVVSAWLCVLRVMHQVCAKCDLCFFVCVLPWFYVCCVSFAWVNVISV